MSFILFQAIFAVLVVAFVAVAVRIGRELRPTRRPDAAAPEVAPQARRSLPSIPWLARKAAEPVPEPHDPPPVRKRQLHSFAEAERVEPSPSTDHAAAEQSTPPEEACEELVLGRLEAAFEALQAGEIALEAYRAEVQAELDRIEQRIALLESSGADEELGAALTARESVRWCIDWAAAQERQ